MKHNSFKDPISRDIGYLSLLVCVLSLQVMIALVLIYQFIPLKMDPITLGVPQTLLKAFHPNRNHFFYHIYIAAAIIGQGAALYFLRKRLGQRDWSSQMGNFLICETLWVSWQLFAVFKILQYDNPLWARILLYAGLAVTLGAKIFWPEVRIGIHRLDDLLRAKEIPRLWRKLVDGSIFCILLFVIAIPDTEKALVRMAMADGNNHFDQWLMAPLWAYHKGLVPALQAYNPLNWGVPVLIHALDGFTGGISYGHVIGTLCFLAIIYYIAFYYFLRYWLGILAAAFGVLLAVKLQMFHLGINPLIWVFPGQSVLRHLPDVGVFFCLLAFARGQGLRFLWLAAAGVGFSMAFVFDTGFYMLAALYAYVAVLLSFKDTCYLICPTPKQWRNVLGLFLLPWLVMLFVLTLCFGPCIWHSDFWTKSFQDIPSWINGAGAVSIFSCLRERNFFAFFASFVPPLIYAMGLSDAISRVFDRRWKSEQLFLIPISVYGLGVYAHFLWHAAINYYYLVPLPLVGCICFWGTEFLNGLTRQRQRAVKMVLATGACIALLTNFLFTYYPNIFNLAQEDWAGQKAYYRANFSFDSDTDLIRHWTMPDERVALISGFDTQLLLQADRAPFFYKSLSLMDQADLQSLLVQLDEGKPSKVFINKEILSSAGLAPLADYLKGHYQYTGQQSDRLALMQRDHE